MSESSTSSHTRRKGRVAPPPVTQSANQVKGTVLLRTPMPKYSFEQKPKKTVNTKTETKVKNGTEDSASKTNSSDKNESIKAKSQSETNKDNTVQPATKAQTVEPVQIGTFLKSFPQAYVNPNDLNQTLSQTSVNKPKENSDQSGSVAIMKDKPVNKVGPISKSLDNKLTHSVSDSFLGTQTQNFTRTLQNSANNGAAYNQENVNVELGRSRDGSVNDDEQSEAGTDNDGEDLDRALVLAGSQNSSCNCKSKIKHLEEEKQMLKNQLEVQLQVNQELKKLLVASVGEDLQHRVERLTRDRALMTQEIGDYSRQITDGYENLDQISIQADMWRSKYLACRVMADEVASSKAFFQTQFQECQMAIEKLLNERHQLRANLYDTYRGLEQIQEAFDPLKAQGVGRRVLTSKNVLNLATTNQHLVEAIKYRLLPSHVTSAINSNMELDWHDYLTQAESHAKELLSREMRPEDFRCLVPTRAPGSLSVDRYHPCANYDNLTINVCCKCKGEIKIV